MFKEKVCFFFVFHSSKYGGFVAVGKPVSYVSY